MLSLNGSIKEYAWGGSSYISQLFGIENPERKPYAEIWFGTHPGGPSFASTGQSLASYLHTELPYLVKVLDVNEMLSIQTHPNLDQAKHGFDLEQKKGIPIDSPIRTYKDDNHKPELMVALSEFYLLQGFKPVKELQKTFSAIPFFSPLLPVFKQRGLTGLYAHIMNMDQADINKILKPLGQKIKPLFKEGKLSKLDVHYWAAKAFHSFNRKGFCDRGIISIYLMNLLKLNEGEGIFQGPGILHAYLEGQNLECMACSDNVLRGGLTQKHINIEDLLETVVFEHGHSEIIQPKSVGKGICKYQTPAPEFGLYQITNEAENQILDLPNSKLVILLNGKTNVDTRLKTENLTSANAYFFSNEEQLRFYEISSDLKLFLATTSF